MLTPSSKSSDLSSVNRMGLGDSVVDERMDLDENNERLSAQVKAIQVLSTVRAMQDEIQDINQQIQAENKKLQMNSKVAPTQPDAKLQSEIEQLVSEMGLSEADKSVDENDEVQETMASSNIGDALRILAQRRQKIKNQQKLIAEAQLNQAQASLQAQQKLKLEKDQLVSQIETASRSRINKAKLKTRAKMRQAFLDRLQQKKAQDAHKGLIEASNQRVLSRLENMQDRRRKVAELKKQRALQRQLIKTNAVRLLQAKKLENLRKQNSNANSSPGLNKALASLQTTSALTRLSPQEKLQMLSWLDLERNAEILASTDKKIKDKMKAKLTTDKLVQQAARQVVDDYDDYYDDLTDEEIDEILVTLTGGGGGALDIEDDYYDDLLDEYVDDVDLLDILGDYDVEQPRRPAVLPVQPIQPIVPGLTPVQPALTPIQPVATPPPFIQHPVTPAGPVYTPTPAPPYHYPPTTPSPYYPTVTPTYHSTPYHHPPPVTPTPYHDPYSTPKPYYKDHYSHHHDYSHHDDHYNHHDDRYKHHDDHKTVTHFHIHGKAKKPAPPPPPTPTPAVEIHHYHSTPEPLYKEEHYYTKPKPHFYHVTTRPPRNNHHYEPLPPGPPYPTKYKYEDEYDYEYYDSYDPPPIHFDPHKVKFFRPTTTPGPFSYSTPPPSPYINTYTTPVTPKPFYTTTVAPYHHRPRHIHHHEDPYYHHDDYYEHSGPGHFGSSGHRFLEGVSAIFDGAATGALHPHDVGPVVRSTLLQDIQDKVHSELSLGPEGGPFTDVVVGNTTPPPPPPVTQGPPPPFLPHFEPRVDITPKGKPIKKRKPFDGFATGSSDTPKAKKRPVVEKIPSKGPEPNGQLSFSELMSDFLQKPLPFNAAQKKRPSAGR